MVCPSYRDSTVAYQMCTECQILWKLVDVQAECKKAMAMAGQENFLFVFGFVAPQYILMEFFCEANGWCCPTLRKVLPHCTVLLRTAIKIATNICIAIHDLHVRGLLHNDLHSGNILVWNASHVKMINFGKWTLVTDPLKYDIVSRSKHYERFNMCISLGITLTSLLNLWKSRCLPCTWCQNPPRKGPISDIISQLWKK